MSDLSAGLPAGGSESAAPASNPAGNGTPAAGGASPITISDDTLVQLPGQAKPVKYGEYYRSYQSQFTKKSQEAAQAAQRLSQYQQEIQQRDAQLAEYRRREAAASAAQPGQNLRSQLAQLQYLDGNAAATLVDHVSQQFEGFQNAIAQRDAALSLIVKQMQQQGATLQALQSRASGTDFDSKINRFVSELGLPQAASTLAKEIYLAYEGDDLDQEFPEILRSRWEQVQNLVSEANKQRAEQARQRAWVPGRGGVGAAGKSAQEWAKATPAQIADDLWGSLVEGGPQT